MRLLLAEDRDEHVDRGYLLAAARLHVENGALQHALEAQRRLDLGFLVVPAQPRRRVVDEVLELAAQPSEIGAARSERLHDLRSVEQGEQ